MKSRRDDKILNFRQAYTLIPKGWHDLRETHDTPSGLLKRRTPIHHRCTPSEFLLGYSSLDRVVGYGLKYPDEFKNTHLGVIGRQSES